MVMKQRERKGQKYRDRYIERQFEMERESGGRGTNIEKGRMKK